MGQWKAVRLKVARNPDAPIQLFDLTKDIGETKNIADANPDIIAKIKPLFTTARTESDLFPMFQKKK